MIPLALVVVSIFALAGVSDAQGDFYEAANGCRMPKTFFDIKTGSHFEYVYYKINDYLESKVHGDDLDANLDAAMERLDKLKEVAGFLRDKRQIKALEQFAAFADIQGQDKCNPESNEIMQNNFEATMGRAAAPKDGQPPNCRIDRLVHHFIVGHVKECKSNYLARFWLVEDRIKSTLGSSLARLVDAIIRDAKGLTVATVVETGSWVLAPRVGGLLQSALREELARAKDDKFKEDLVDLHIREPCKNFRVEFGYDLLEPALSNYDLWQKTGASGELEPQDEAGLLRAIMANTICARLLEKSPGDLIELMKTPVN